MKKNQLVFKLITMAGISTFLIGDFEDDVASQFYEASIEGDISGFLTGDVTLSDIADMSRELGEGAPAGTALRRAVQKSMAKKATGASPAVKSALSASSKLPGVALMGAFVPPVVLTGGRVINPGTVRTLSGNLLKASIDNMPIINPFLSVSKAVQGNANPAILVSVSFADADKPAGCGIYSFPMIFITVASSQLSARIGQRYTITITGFTRDGVAITTDSWHVERDQNGTPLRMIYIPYVRRNDTLVPVAGAFGDIGGVAQDIAFTVSITGMPDTENMQVVLPGLDSTEYESFLKEWGLSMIR